MPVNIICGNETSRNLSWKEKQKLLLDAKNYETRSRAQGIMLPSYGQRLNVIYRSPKYSNSQSFDDS